MAAACRAALAVCAKDATPHEAPGLAHSQRVPGPQVGDALQYESAKAHIKEGRSGRTSNRLAHRLFEGLDWEVGCGRRVMRVAPVAKVSRSDHVSGGVEGGVVHASSDGCNPG